MATLASETRERIGPLYAAYNARDLSTLTALVREDVDWPDNEDRLHGRATVRDYWSRQWSQTRTHDEVIAIADLGHGATAVRISQVVRDLDGVVLSRGFFEHTFEFRDGLVARMDIRPLQPPELAQEQ